MSATHNVLWKRVTAALQSRGVEPSGGPREVAAEARTKLGTDLVEQKFDGVREPPKCNLGPLQKTLLMTKFFGIDGVPFLVLPSTKTYRGGTNNLKELLENDIKSLAEAK